MTQRRLTQAVPRTEYREPARWAELAAVFILACMAAGIMLAIAAVVAPRLAALAGRWWG